MGKSALPLVSASLLPGCRLARYLAVHADACSTHTRGAKDAADNDDDEPPSIAVFGIFCIRICRIRICLDCRIVHEEDALLPPILYSVRRVAEDGARV